MLRTLQLCIRPRALTSSIQTITATAHPRSVPLASSIMSRTKRRWMHPAQPRNQGAAAAQAHSQSSGEPPFPPTAQTSRQHPPKHARGRAASRHGQKGGDENGEAPRHSRSMARQPSAKRPQNRKRRASEEPDDSSRPKKARKQYEDLPETLLDEKYIMENMDYPTREQYPHSPKGFPHEPNQVPNVLNSIRRLQFRQEFKITHIHRHSNPLYTCTVRADLPSGETLTAEGQAWAKRDASRAGYMHFAVKLHEMGLLESFFPPPEKVLDKETLLEEKNAKVDIYNYCARFALIPRYSMRLIDKPGRFQSGKKIPEVTIELKEQNIKVVGRGHDLRTAEISACLKFKEQAEAYHAEHGEESISVRDSTALNLGNVKQFVEFYKVQNRGASFEAVLEEIPGPKVSHLFEGRIKLNGDFVGEPVVMATKKGTEELAYLVAAVALMKEDPDMHNRFQQALAAGNGNILHDMRPLDMDVDEDAIALMQETLRDARIAGLSDLREEMQSDEDRAASRSVRERRRLNEDEKERKSRKLRQKYDAFMTDSYTQQLRETRDNLPMSQYRDKVLEQVSNNLYSIIIGATGSGKTTQVPQILLDDAIMKGQGADCNIICTQPRRIAATSVARRVADERNEQLQSSVGYQVRFDPKLPQPGGSITYCTTGVLLQQLQSNPDDIFDTISHIVIDEVHERDILIDFLMVILKNTVNARLSTGKSVPQIVLMSATIDSELFSKYFERKSADGKILPCPSLSVPGRTFPVKEKFLENIVEELRQAHGDSVVSSMREDEATRTYMNLETELKPSQPDSSTEVEEIEATIDWKRERTFTVDGQEANEVEDSIVPIPLIATTIAHIAKTTEDGAILVFLPGYEEIKKVRQILEERPLGIDFLDPAKFKVFMLHSTVPAAEQAEVFNSVPGGCRKVILSTNIAETSVTIPDIQYVVDSGKLREMRYDQIRRITKLQCTWVSKSNAKQRAGRAGRVQNGNYYALYSKARFQSIRTIGLPEMLRSDLQEICLDIKAQAFKSPIRDFLAQAIEPPPPAAVDASVLNLIALQALTEDEKLTSLGRLLASLPVHPSLGKMIILGIIFRCLDPMIILGAALNERSPFVSPMDKRKEAHEKHRRFLDGSSSDHYALVNAVRTMRRITAKSGEFAARSYGMDNFIHLSAYRVIDATSRQIEEVLVENGVIPRGDFLDKHADGQLGGSKLNRNSNNITLIKALALSGTHPNLAVATRGPMFRTPGEKNAMLHPSSLNSLRSSHGNYAYGTLFSYSTMQRSNDGKSIGLRDTTASSPLMAVLFGGRLRAEGAKLTMDGWLPFYLKSGWYSRKDVVKTVLEFRKALDRVLTGAYSDLKNVKDNVLSNNHKNFGSVILGTREEGTYLADNKVRETFASGLVEILGYDRGSVPRPINTREEAGRRFEGRGKQSNTNMDFFY